MEPEFVAHFGSRNGSLAALALFSILFGGLGTIAGRECRRRGWKRGAAVFAGLLLSLGPVTGIYATSLNGFYELRSFSTHVELRFLLPIGSSRVNNADIESVAARPAFRGRWRLILEKTLGEQVVSATWNRQDVEAAADALGHTLEGQSR